MININVKEISEILNWTELAQTWSCSGILWWP